MMSKQRIRFTIAYEIGHIVLGHLSSGANAICNREPAPYDSIIEYQANIFASRLLAPACVLRALDANTPEKIAQYCDISLQSAQIRAERIQTLKSRNKFGLSPLEAKVYRQFWWFIRRNVFLAPLW